MSVAYLASPYTDPDPKVKQLRHAIVTQLAFELIRQGILVYSPIVHNIPIDRLGIHGNWITWKEFDHQMAARCDRLIVAKIPGWEQSRGVAAEVAHAQELGHPIEWMEVSEETIQRAKNSLNSPFQGLLERMQLIYTERDWAQFHSPKNLSMNLAVEMGELLEHFRWLTEPQSYVEDPAKLSAIRDEIGDVFTVLLHLAHTLGIDPLAAAHDKLTQTANKYPADRCKGLAEKYTAYQPKQNN